jgi:hypothetical protein
MAARVRKKKPAPSTAPAVEASPAAPAAAAQTSPAPATAPPAPLVYLDLPPADSNIPVPPPEFVAGDTADYRAVLPRDAELRALPTAVKDLGKFTNYTQILGDTAPPYEEVLRAFTAANGWSSARTRTAAWDAFCGSQEGIAWTTLRAQMERLQPSFELAAGGSSNIDTMFPGLASLLGAKKVIARKGASTRKANTKAEGEGKPATHGVVGKARQKRAAKAALAAANAVVVPAPPPVSTSTAPQTPAAAPQVSAVPASPAPVVTAQPPASGPTNGAAH